MVHQSLRKQVVMVVRDDKMGGENMGYLENWEVFWKPRFLKGPKVVS